MPTYDVTTPPRRKPFVVVADRFERDDTQLRFYDNEILILVGPPDAVIIERLGT